MRPSSAMVQRVAQQLAGRLQRWRGFVATIPQRDRVVVVVRAGSRVPSLPLSVSGVPVVVAGARGLGSASAVAAAGGGVVLFAILAGTAWGLTRMIKSDIDRISGA